MVNATLAIHLGLTVALGKLITKILSCNKCLTFWCTLLILYLFNCNIIIAVLLSLLGAYTSNWFALILVKFNQKYIEIWQRLNKK